MPPYSPDFEPLGKHLLRVECGNVTHLIGIDDPVTGPVLCGTLPEQPSVQPDLFGSPTPAPSKVDRWRRAEVTEHICQTCSIIASKGRMMIDEKRL